MKSHELGKEFSIAILIGDINEAKELSLSLRELGIFAHFYSELDEFWLGVNESTPDLSIIDVEKISQGNLLLSSHPKVISGALSCAFYYNDENSALLESTLSFNHYGFIKKEINQLAQLKNIFERKENEIALRQRTKELEGSVARITKRSQEISSGANEFFEFEKSVKNLNDFMEKIGEFTKGDKFTQRLASVLSTTDFCSRFSFYEINQTGQKMISPSYSVLKYKSLPSLWLGKVCLEGLELFSQEMAMDVALDEFDLKKLKLIKIAGKFNNPDILLLLEVKENTLKNFPWTIFERELSGVYRKSQLVNVDHRVEGDRFIPFWDAFSLMDDIYFHKVSSKTKVFSVSLKNLIKVASEKHANRFYYKAFFTDFLCSLADIIPSGKISVTSAHDVMVMIDTSSMEKELLKLKEFLSTFSYHKYFEDGSILMGENTFPEIKMIAHSSVNYLKNTEMMSLVEEADVVAEKLSKKWMNRPFVTNSL